MKEDYEEPEWLYSLKARLPRDPAPWREYAVFLFGVFLTSASGLLLMIEPEFRAALLWLAGIVAAASGVAMIHCYGSSGPPIQFASWMEQKAKADAWSNEWTPDKVEQLERYLEVELAIHRRIRNANGNARPRPELVYAQSLRHQIALKHGAPERSL